MPTSPLQPPRPARLRGGVAALVGLAVLVAGCSGGGSGDASGGASSPASSSSAPSGAASPGGSAAPATARESPPVAPRARRGPAGQKAFARHVMDLWGYALRTNDPRPLTRLGAGTGPCGGCAQLARELAKRRSQGWSVDFAGLDVRRVGVSGRGPVVTSRAVVDVPESSSFTTDGTFRNTSPAHPGARFEVRMRFTPRGYRLLSFTVS